MNASTIKQKLFSHENEICFMLKRANTRVWILGQLVARGLFKFLRVYEYVLYCSLVSEVVSFFETV